MYSKFIFSLLLFLKIIAAIADDFEDIPPEPMYAFQNEIYRSLDNPNLRLASNNVGEVWEQSGYFEGDIVLDGSNTRNAMKSKRRRWPESTIPYYINKKEFDSDDRKFIRDALKVFHKKTSVHFRPYEDGDENFVTIRGNSTGCWSYVGMKTGGQVLHLENPRCMKKKTIIHEFVHVLGLKHQQSASNRDEYIKILFQNIKKGKKNNFKKMEKSIVTDFKFPYDYDSVMHYSEKAFSKNGKKTIIPLVSLL